ncbi:MAG: GNAT family N-acetyltransferase [Clostridia bacterium]|nr:GNAT family N-acetyltransferase [Clostridia bacterium]
MSLEIKMAIADDVNEIAKIYKSLIGYPGCTWSEEYPTIEDVENDINKKSLYVMQDKGKIIAVAAAGKDDELENLECWNKEIKFPCDLARIGVIKEYQNKGIAKELVRYIEKDVINRGFDGIHFLVSKTNPRALALYNNLEYCCCGETIMYDIDWFCYEKKLKK